MQGFKVLETIADEITRIDGELVKVTGKQVVRRQHSSLERADQIRKQSLNIKD